MFSVDVKHYVPFKLNNCVGDNLLCVRDNLAVNMKRIFENDFYFFIFFTILVLSLCVAFLSFVSFCFSSSLY